MCTNIVWMSKPENNFCTQHVLNVYFSGNSMNNLLSYCELTDARMRTFIWHLSKLVLWVSVVIQELKFCKLLSFWVSSFFSQFLSWEKIWEDLRENLKHKIRTPSAFWRSISASLTSKNSSSPIGHLAVIKLLVNQFKMIDDEDNLGHLLKVS